MSPKARKSVRRPLSPRIYLLRNWGKSLPLVGVITLAVMLIAGLVSLMDSIPLSIETIYKYSRFSLGVSTRGDQQAVEEVRAKILDESSVPIGRVMTCRVSNAMVESIVGSWPFAVLALEQDDLPYYVERIGGGEITGRYPDAGQPEILISRPVATNLGVDMGDTLLRPDSSDNYSPQEVKVVGILESEEWVMLASVEYHRAYHFPPIDLLIAFSENPQEQQRLDDWAIKAFEGEPVRLYAYVDMQRETDESFKTLYTILNIVIFSLVIVITVMMGMLINIYQSQRTQEFGLMQAIGYTKSQILKRVLAETSVVLLGSWLFGVVMAFLLLFLVKSQLFDPRAFGLDPFNPRSYLYSLPVPVAIFGVSAFDLLTRFRKFDPVQVVERRLA